MLMLYSEKVFGYNGETKEVKIVFKKYSELILKSIGAAILIALGDYALLKLGEPIGPVIFAFGLIGVCYMGQNLFTGKCGFLIDDKIRLFDLILILAVNLVAGYLMGVVFSAIGDADVLASAAAKVAGWEVSFPFFVKSLMCGAIMYVAVLLYRKGTPLGIIFGVPLFIFCGFQHCIANVITMGVATAFDWSLFVCVAGNFLGSLIMWLLAGQIFSNKQLGNRDGSDTADKSEKKIAKLSS